MKAAQSLVESKRSKDGNIMDKSEADLTRNKFVKISEKLLWLSIGKKIHEKFIILIDSIKSQGDWGLWLTLKSCWPPTPPTNNFSKNSG